MSSCHTSSSSSSSCASHASGPACSPGSCSGTALLQNSSTNKGLGFTHEERKTLGLRGRLPAAVIPLPLAVNRELQLLRALPTDIEKYRFLTDLQDRNETLFYKLVMNHAEEMTPYLYTPTVGQACIDFSLLYRRPRGLFFSVEDLGHVHEAINAWPHDVRVIVVTDGERILGLGDLGANGMGIPIGKLTLYTAFAGIPPTACLPVTLDVGTENRKLLADPFYIGHRHPRIRDQSYDRLVREFFEAAHARWKPLIQFEDFGNANAFRLLDTYKDDYCTFNDDIQGTASVVLAGLFGAVDLTGIPLHKHLFLFLGAGEAGTGIGEMLVASMVEKGISEEEARKRCWFVDSRGLVVKGREGGKMPHHKEVFAHDHPFIRSFEDCVTTLKPTCIIGVSGQGSTFTKAIVKSMSQFNRQPIIFALSNPTSQSECTAAQAYKWSKGAAIFASGSPFPPYTYISKRHDVVVERVPGQGNNAYIFPGVGLGVMAARARKVTQKMFLVAAKTLAGLVTGEQFAHGCVYPPLSTIRTVSLAIAVSVAKSAEADGLCTVPPPKDWESYIRSLMYEPNYGAVPAAKL